MTSLFGWLKAQDRFRARERSSFSRAAAHFLSELDAIHPFRDGNGRAQMAFMSLLATRAGHPFKLQRLRRKQFMNAVIASFGGDEGALVEQIDRLTA